MNEPTGRLEASAPRREVVLRMGLAAAICSFAAGAFASDRASAPNGPRGSSTPPSACDGGVILDDGSLETGYGWVPSAVDGRYVQEFDADDWGAERGTTEVCVCWTRTSNDSSVDFTVELYRRGVDGVPELVPEYAIQASATGVPAFPEGQFTSVEVPGWPTLPGTFFLGVRWNPSVDPFFFVCADQTESTPFVEAWFIDDRASGWGNASNSGDPIFEDHSALLIRTQPGPASFPVDVPAAGPWALLLLAGLLAAGGAWFLARS